MCGRYSLTTAPEALRRLFQYVGQPNLAPRYNIAPTQSAPVIRPGEGRGARELALLRWGLVPRWAEDLSVGARMINARAETVAVKPAFREAFRARRCLVPADGFYEWRSEDGGKQPFRIGFRGGGAFAFAGLWERWRAPGAAGDSVETFTILTGAANPKLAPIHPRMPVILEPRAYGRWLDTAPEQADALAALLVPHPPEEMAFHRVSPRVNNVRHDDPGCIAPLAETG